MKKIKELIPCVSMIGLLVYLAEDFFETIKMKNL